MADRSWYGEIDPDDKDQQDGEHHCSPRCAHERCPECGGAMELAIIGGHDSWACPVDAYAYAVDQDE